jgi:hypothetical protein
MNTSKPHDKPGVSKHHTVVLRPMPGSRFTIWGADCNLEFLKGKTQEQINWLANWIVSYLQPLADREREAMLAAQEASGEVPAPDLPQEVAPSPTHEMQAEGGEYQGPRPITSLPFIKEANGAKHGGFRAEDYENNK